MRRQNHENALMMPDGREQCVFSASLKAFSDRPGDRSAGGRRFHVAGPLTAKLVVQARGTSGVPVAADADDLRWQ